MHVVISRFRVANDKRDEVRAAFENRPGLVESAPGFVRLDVIQPADDPDQFWLYTVWRDEASFHDWHRGHAYKASHQAIPGGLRLDPEATEIRHFEHVTS